MAPHTAVALALLSVGILLARHEAGPIMRVLSRDTAGGLLARRALPAAIGAPLLVGLLEVLAYDASLFSARFGGALFAVTMIVFFCVLIWSTALRVDRVDRHRLEAERFALRERELRRTAEELRAEAAERTAQLEIEAGTREELLAIVSHDLRAPLSAIAFAAQSVDMRARRVDDDAASGGLRKSAETILRSCDQMDSLIVSLLDFAAARHGTLAIEPPRPVAAAALLEDARTFLLPSAEKKSVRLEVDASDVLALCDRRRVVQVITNLGVNAIKFTPAGGRVRISAHARRRSVEFEVADTGVGIREEDAARIFDPYWRGTSKARGIGLGLFIARTIVEAHGGRIEVSSRPNEGAVFRFTIPAGQGAPRQPHA